ncbi:MAG: PilT/PilU family type 4a pilus ATPase [Egibacteraceae bacterium]
MSMQLGQTLVQDGLIDHYALERATAHHQATGATLSRALAELGIVDERTVTQHLSQRAGLPFVEIQPATVDPSAAGLLAQEDAMRLGALPVSFTSSHELLVAVSDLDTPDVAAELAALTGLPVTLALAVATELHQGIVALTQPGAGSAGNGPAVAGSAGADGSSGNGSEPAVPAPASGTLAYEQEAALDLDRALTMLMDSGGSDLHLTAGLPPMIRLHGELEPLDGFPKLTPPELQKTLYSILTQRQRERFENELELDISYSIPQIARFRVNVFQQRDAIGSVMRLIPYEIKPLAELGIPAQVANFAYLPRGFVLVTGPTGSGKSTTLASLVDLVNRERACHIMTVEDPIEFLHSHQRSVVNQRELGTDTHSFAAALKHVLRQDPDVILVGEMRDLETIQVALTAAETGHLLFGTLHTQDAPQTIDRVVDVFPPHQQEQIRVMLSGALQGVVCQQLVKTRDGAGRVVACEVMVATSAIKNLIREGKTHQMYSSIQAGKQHGMVTMDQSLATLVLSGQIDYGMALEKCNNVADFNRLCGRA